MEQTNDVHFNLSSFDRIDIINIMMTLNYFFKFIHIINNNINILLKINFKI